MRSRHLTGLAGLTIVAVLALAGCSGSDSDATATDDAPTTGASCTYSGDGGTPAKEVDPPPSTAADSGQVEVEIATSVGKIGATLDAGKTPCTVNSFVSLAKQGYFDDTPCHRLTTSGIYVLQCGDPSGTGGGGPGYTYDDELDSLPAADADGTIAYPAGTLAMANAGPSTNGSQFFIVYGDSRLPPAYTVFGTVDDAGLQVVKDVAAQGTTSGGPDGAPKQTVDITGVTVSD